MSGIDQTVAEAAVGYVSISFPSCSHRSGRIGCVNYLDETVDGSLFVRRKFEEFCTPSFSISFKINAKTEDGVGGFGWRVTLSRSASESRCTCSAASHWVSVAMLSEFWMHLKSIWKRIRIVQYAIGILSMCIRDTFDMHSE